MLLAVGLKKEVARRAAEVEVGFGNQIPVICDSQLDLGFAQLVVSGRDELRKEAAGLGKEVTRLAAEVEVGLERSKKNPVMNGTVSNSIRGLSIWWS